MSPLSGVMDLRIVSVYVCVFVCVVSLCEALSLLSVLQIPQVLA